LIEKEKCTLQHAVTVVMNVKYHSNQKKTDLFIAENVSKTTNQPPDKVVEDLAVDLVDLVVTEALDLVEETIDHVKCMMQNAVTVVMIVKYHLSQKKTDLFIAENVSKITEIRTIVLSNFQNYFIL
jgi:homoserine dehydrogenase